jgi:hypothetical protein
MRRSIQDIRREIAEIQNEIETLGGKLNRLTRQVIRFYVGKEQEPDVPYRVFDDPDNP